MSGPGRDEAGADHRPVMVAEAVAAIQPAPGDVIVDCTVGSGGTAAAFLEHMGDTGTLIAIDRDNQALEIARRRLSPCRATVRFFHADYAELDQVLELAGVDKVDGIFYDLGVSSMQLRPGRGFSFQHDEPLDMRMDPTQGRTAADVVNDLRESELADVIFRYGEEHRSRRIARAICRERTKSRILTTGRLADIAARALPGRSRIHPATKLFQSIRIFVNSELESLERSLAAAPAHLSSGARVCAVSFHSLEDRCVKTSFRDNARAGVYRVLTPKPLRPTPEEAGANPRSRSARLRAAERC